ncbi:hypothetical protein [Paenibacillus naphthalenovorans]|uniref:Uncharacterized protein n=1 Tax=Paenibacillus naphthalenovorans TaxID=162209 RepID=A0A0U2W0Z9_9BACL|nr:hypothetical protein [Paenibacillus naphthalenovorans]ALS22212.1 hypothetical protein IJ22_18380 [Paenibacillus naphthalenovorans]
MNDFKQYYIDRIINCAIENKLYEYTIEKLEWKTENELIAIWDNLRWNYGDLTKLR